MATKCKKCNDCVPKRGERGLKGPAGNNGQSAYQVWLGLGNTGTEADFINSLIGPQGQGGVTTGGTNVTITGAGTVGDPYVVNSTSGDCDCPGMLHYVTDAIGPLVDYNADLTAFNYTSTVTGDIEIDFTTDVQMSTTSSPLDLTVDIICKKNGVLIDGNTSRRVRMYVVIEQTYNFNTRLHITTSVVIGDVISFRATKNSAGVILENGVLKINNI